MLWVPSDLKDLKRSQRSFLGISEVQYLVLLSSMQIVMVLDFVASSLGHLENAAIVFSTQIKP